MLEHAIQLCRKKTITFKIHESNLKILKKGFSEKLHTIQRNKILTIQENPSFIGSCFSYILYFTVILLHLLI
jgi:hypothetical protein